MRVPQRFYTKWPPWRQQNLRKTALANILEIVCVDIHQNRHSKLGCRADTNTDTYTHTYTRTYTHPRLDSNIFSQNIKRDTVLHIFDCLTLTFCKKTTTVIERVNVTTALFVIYFAVLSRLPFAYQFFQIDISCSSTYVILYVIANTILKKSVTPERSCLWHFLRQNPKRTTYLNDPLLGFAPITTTISQVNDVRKYHFYWISKKNK